jgi:TonB-dependent SusC/RagA subfamily outer membrane receptor
LLYFKIIGLLSGNPISTKMIKNINQVYFIISLVLLMSCASSGYNKNSSTQIDQGYGSIDANKNTTAISQIDLSNNQNANITWIELLQRTSGVSVSGHGNDLSIQIRGKKSMSAGNEPLFVLEDKILGNGFSYISFVDANMVKRISVLKDGASASAYGSRGADGVILVTLK